MKKQEQHQEEQEDRNPADSLQKRRSAIIEYFRRYLRLTFEELRAASAREAAELRAPLLAMRLDEEEILGWERFRDEFAPRAIHAAEALVAEYESLLDAEGARLLERGSVERWRQFFRSSAVDFKDKLRALAELRTTLSVERDIAEERQRVIDVLEKREEKDVARRVREERETPEVKHGKQKEKAEELSPADQENTGQNLPKQKNPMIDELEDDEGMEAALRALPLSLQPLYRAAVERGAEAVSALMQVMAQRIHYEEQPVEQPCDADGRFVVLWRDESMNAPKRALRHVQCMAKLGSAQPVVVPQGVSCGSQAEIVRHIHPVLQENIG